MSYEIHIMFYVVAWQNGNGIEIKIGSEADFF